jgi:hypothetical protein
MQHGDEITEVAEVFVVSLTKRLRDAELCGTRSFLATDARQRCGVQLDVPLVSLIRRPQRLAGVAMVLKGRNHLGVIGWHVAL